MNGLLAVLSLVSYVAVSFLIPQAGPTALIAVTVAALVGGYLIYRSGTDRRGQAAPIDDEVSVEARVGAAVAGRESPPAKDGVRSAVEPLVPRPITPVPRIDASLRTGDAARVVQTRSDQSPRHRTRKWSARLVTSTVDVADAGVVVRKIHRLKLW